MEFTNKLFEFNNVFSNEFYKVDVGKIFQVSELSLAAGGEIEEHLQICDEITYVISGSARFYIGNDETELAPRQICYIKKGLLHRIVANSDFRYLCVGVIVNPENGYVGRFLKSAADKEWFVKNDSGDIRITMEMLVNEFYFPDGQTNDMVSLYMSTLYVRMVRLLEGESREPRQKPGAARIQHTVYRIIRYIDREYMNIKSVGDIAKRFSYSEYYLAHLFKEKVGVSIKQYIVMRKMERAAELLRKTNISVTDISEQLGFCSPHTFSQAFKKAFLISPSAFRGEHSNL